MMAISILNSRLNLSKISGTVVALEEDEIFFNEAEKNLKVYELDNCKLVDL